MIQRLEGSRIQGKSKAFKVQCLRCKAVKKDTRVKGIHIPLPFSMKWIGETGNLGSKSERIK
jgi:hypothetical protein